MAFGKISKQDLIDAGLDPDKFAGLIGTAVTKADFDALKGEMVTKTQFDEIKNSLAELTTKLTAPKTTPTVTNPDTNRQTLTPEEIRAQQYEEFTSDPVSFIQKMSGSSSAFAATESKKLARQMAYDNAKGVLTGFRNDALRAEIDTEWAKYTAEGMVRANADPVELIKKIHDMVMGAHIEDISRDSAKKEGKYNLVHSGGGGGSSNFSTNNRSNEGGGTRKPEEMLTTAELESAKQFGMTAQEWIDSKKAVDTETGLYSKTGVVIQ